MPRRGRGPRCMWTEELLRHIAFNDAYYAEIESAIQQPGHLGMYCIMRICFQRRVFAARSGFWRGRAQSGAEVGGSDLEANAPHRYGIWWRALDSLEKPRRGTPLEEEPSAAIVGLRYCRKRGIGQVFTAAAKSNCCLLESLAREGHECLALCSASPPEAHSFGCGLKSAAERRQALARRTLGFPVFHSERVRAPTSYSSPPPNTPMRFRLRFD